MTTSDALLLRRAARGHAGAFETLWSRHADAVRNTAHAIDATCDPEDVTQECFTQLFAALKNGDHIDGPLRPYLYVLTRHIITAWQDPTAPTPTPHLPDIWEDTPDTIHHSEHVTTAFRALPPEWRSVLWYTEVEGMQPSDLAPILGISANAVAALAYRAREGLRNAWLQAHVTAHPSDNECAWVTERLAQHARGTLSPRQTQRMQRHLHHCSTCPRALADVQSVAARLRSSLAPLFLVPVGVGALSTTTDAALTSPLHAAWSATTVKIAAIAPVKFVGALAVTGLIGVGLSSGLLLAQAWAQPADNGPAPLAGIDSARPDFGAQQYSATSQYQQTGSEPDEAAGLFGASANSTQQPNDTEHADTTTVNDPATTTADTATDTDTPARQETPGTPATQSTPTQQQSEPDASSNEAASHTEQPEETPSLQQTHASKNPIFFSGRAPWWAHITVLDDTGTEVGRIKAGADGNWGLSISDTYSDSGRTHMTYRIYASKDDYSTAGEPFAVTTVTVPTE